MRVCLPLLVSCGLVHSLAHLFGGFACSCEFPPVAENCSSLNQTPPREIIEIMEREVFGLGAPTSCRLVVLLNLPSRFVPSINLTLISHQSASVLGAVLKSAGSKLLIAPSSRALTPPLPPHPPTTDTSVDPPLPPPAPPEAVAAGERTEL